MSLPSNVFQAPDSNFYDVDFPDERIDPATIPKKFKRFCEYLNRVLWSDPVCQLFRRNLGALLTAALKSPSNLLLMNSLSFSTERDAQKFFVAYCKYASKADQKKCLIPLISMGLPPSNILNIIGTQTVLDITLAKKTKLRVLPMHALNFETAHGVVVGKNIEVSKEKHTVKCVCYNKTGGTLKLIADDAKAHRSRFPPGCVVVLSGLNDAKNKMLSKLATVDKFEAGFMHVRVFDDNEQFCNHVEIPTITVSNCNAEIELELPVPEQTKKLLDTPINNNILSYMPFAIAPAVEDDELYKITYAEPEKRKLPVFTWTDTDIEATVKGIKVCMATFFSTASNVEMYPCVLTVSNQSVEVKCLCDATKTEALQDPPKRLVQFPFMALDMQASLVASSPNNELFTTHNGLPNGKSDFVVGVRDHEIDTYSYNHQWQFAAKIRTTADDVSKGINLAYANDNTIICCEISPLEDACFKPTNGLPSNDQDTIFELLLKLTYAIFHKNCTLIIWEHSKSRMILSKTKFDDSEHKALNTVTGSATDLYLYARAIILHGACTGKKDANIILKESFQKVKAFIVPNISTLQNLLPKIEITRTLNKFVQRMKNGPPETFVHAIELHDEDSIKCAHGWVDSTMQCTIEAVDGSKTMTNMVYMSCAMSNQLRLKLIDEDQTTRSPNEVAKNVSDFENSLKVYFVDQLDDKQSPHIIFEYPKKLESITCRCLCKDAELNQFKYYTHDEAAGQQVMALDRSQEILHRYYDQETLKNSQIFLSNNMIKGVSGSNRLQMSNKSVYSYDRQFNRCWTNEQQTHCKGNDVASYVNQSNVNSFVVINVQKSTDNTHVPVSFYQALYTSASAIKNAEITLSNHIKAVQYNETAVLRYTQQHKLSVKEGTRLLELLAAFAKPPAEIKTLVMHVPAMVYDDLVDTFENCVSSKVDVRAHHAHTYMQEANPINSAAVLLYVAAENTDDPAKKYDKLYGFINGKAVLHETGTAFDETSIVDETKIRPGMSRTLKSGYTEQQNVFKDETSLWYNSGNNQYIVGVNCAQESSGTPEIYAGPIIDQYKLQNPMYQYLLGLCPSIKGTQLLEKLTTDLSALSTGTYKTTVRFTDNDVSRKKKTQQLLMSDMSLFEQLHSYTFEANGLEYTTCFDDTASSINDFKVGLKSEWSKSRNFFTDAFGTYTFGIPMTSIKSHIKEIMKDRKVHSIRCQYTSGLIFECTTPSLLYKLCNQSGGSIRLVLAPLQYVVQCTIIGGSLVIMAQQTIQSPVVSGAKSPHTTMHFCPAHIQLRFKTRNHDPSGAPINFVLTAENGFDVFNNVSPEWVLQCAPLEVVTGGSPLEQAYDTIAVQQYDKFNKIECNFNREFVQLVYAEYRDKSSGLAVPCVMEYDPGDKQYWKLVAFCILTNQTELLKLSSDLWPSDLDEISTDDMNHMVRACLYQLHVSGQSTVLKATATLISLLSTDTSNTTPFYFGVLIKTEHSSGATESKIAHFAKLIEHNSLFYTTESEDDFDPNIFDKEYTNSSGEEIIKADITGLISP